MRTNKNFVFDLFLGIILSLTGFSLLSLYIFNSSIDVPFSDYIRIINNYIYDVFDFKYLFSTESVSRVPITFLFRIINVEIFKYSVYFDKIVGIISLAIFNLIIILNFCESVVNKYLKIIGSLFISIISFSLISWEMILNGTGYVHFITMALMVLTYHLLENYFIFVDGYSKSLWIILILIFFTSVFCGGSYSVAFLMSIIFFTIFLFVINIFCIGFIIFYKYEYRRANYSCRDEKCWFIANCGKGFIISYKILNKEFSRKFGR